VGSRAQQDTGQPPATLLVTSDKRQSSHAMPSLTYECMMQSTASANLSAIHHEHKVHCLCVLYVFMCEVLHRLVCAVASCPARCASWG
jgi:hypothetical protein